MTEEKSTGQVPNGTNQPRTPTIGIKLTATDYLRFSELCRMKGKNKSDLARKAIREYMDRQENLEQNEIKDRLAETLKSLEASHQKDTERLAKMIARVTMDVGIINQVFYKRAAESERDALWGAARQAATERLKHKRKGGDPEATELMKDALSS